MLKPTYWRRSPQHWRSIAFLSALHPTRFIASLTAGLICGEMTVIYAISFASLIFSGELSPYIATGIGLALFTSVTVSIVVALMSSLAGVAIIPQDAPAVLMGLMAGAIVSQMPAEATASEMLYTVLVAIGLTSILTGLFCWGLGQFKLGEITRAIPYPVVGGFLAGTGWLLSYSALTLMTDMSLGLTQLPQLLQPELLMCWLPGVSFALLLVVVLRRYQHILILPGMVLGAVLLFYVVLFATHTSIPAAREYGLLLGLFLKGGLWQPLQPAIVLQANWGLIWGQMGQVVVIALLTAMALLLNCMGIELVSGRDIDLNQELRAVGIANMVAGLGGGIIGFHGLGLSTLSLAKVQAKSRLVGLIAAAVCAVTLLVGEAMIALVPKPVLGGLALFLGLSFLVEWVYDAWFRLSRSDYGLVMLMLMLIATVGFLQGVALGLGAAMVWSVIHYSRTSVIRTIASGATYKTARPLHQRQLLGRERGQIRVFELQGFLFFGNASKLLDQIRHQIRHQISHPKFLKPKFIVLDFQLVKELDASATLSFVKLEQIAQQHQQTLVFTHLLPHMQRKLQLGGCLNQMHQRFPTLEQGLVWCEEQILANFPWCHDCPLPLVLRHAQQFGHDRASVFLDYLEAREVEAGDLLFRQGDPGDGIYFVESGQIDLFLELGGGGVEWVRSLQAGDLIGEIEFYHQSPYTTTAISSQFSRLYCLSRTAMQRFKQNDPDVASAWQDFVIHHLSQSLLPTYQAGRGVG